MGIRSSPTTEIIFEDCNVPVENVLGNVGEGFKIAMMTLDGGRNGIAAQAVGLPKGPGCCHELCERTCPIRKADFCTAGSCF